MSISERLIHLIRNHYNTDNANFARSINLSKGSLSNLATNWQPGSRFFSEIKSKYPEINMNWLIAGEGEMLLSGGSGSDSGIIPNTEVSGRNQISQNNGKSGTININQHNEQVFRLLEQQLAAQSVTIAAQAKTIEALSQQIARLNEQLNGGNG